MRALMTMNELNIISCTLNGKRERERMKERNKKIRRERERERMNEWMKGRKREKKANKVKEESQFWCQRIGGSSPDQMNLPPHFVISLLLLSSLHSFCFFFFHSFISFAPLPAFDRMGTIRLGWQAWKNKWPEEARGYHKKEISSKWERERDNLESGEKESERERERERESDRKRPRIMAQEFKQFSSSLTRGWLLQKPLLSLTMMSSEFDRWKKEERNEERRKGWRKRKGEESKSVTLCVGQSIVLSPVPLFFCKKWFIFTDYNFHVHSSLLNFSLSLSLFPSFSLHLCKL